jgi:hypothetical protein
VRVLLAVLAAAVVFGAGLAVGSLAGGEEGGGDGASQRLEQAEPAQDDVALPRYAPGRAVAPLRAGGGGEPPAPGVDEPAPATPGAGGGGSAPVEPGVVEPDPEPGAVEQGEVPPPAETEPCNPDVAEC